MHDNSLKIIILLCYQISEGKYLPLYKYKIINLVNQMRGIQKLTTSHSSLSIKTNKVNMNPCADKRRNTKLSCMWVLTSKQIITNIVLASISKI